MHGPPFVHSDKEDAKEGYVHGRLSDYLVDSARPSVSPSVVQVKGQLYGHAQTDQEVCQGKTCNVNVLAPPQSAPASEHHENSAVGGDGAYCNCQHRYGGQPDFEEVGARRAGGICVGRFLSRLTHVGGRKLERKSTKQLIVDQKQLTKQLLFETESNVSRIISYYFDFNMAILTSNID